MELSYYCFLPLNCEILLCPGRKTARFQYLLLVAGYLARNASNRAESRKLYSIATGSDMNSRKNASPAANDSNWRSKRPTNRLPSEKVFFREFIAEERRQKNNTRFNDVAVLLLLWRNRNIAKMIVKSNLIFEKLCEHCVRMHKWMRVS